MALEEIEARVRERVEAEDEDGAAVVVLQELGPEVLGYLRAILRDETDASDAFSIFAEHLWRGISGFRGASSLRTWTYRVAWTAAARIVRDPYRARHERLPTSMASRLADVLRASTALASEAERSTIDGLRAQLTAEEQTLLVLRLDRELSWKEVGEVLAEEGTPPADETALRKRFERVKEKLGKLARDAGLIS